jgi:glycosyltransferase involved in cell wall biosynthesis
MFSIIIPVGPGRDARSALDSLAAAGLSKGDEVIVVVDGHMLALDPVHAALPVRVLSTPSPKGANAARNLGAQAARNAILCFLDDDDAYRPGALARLRRVVAGDIRTGAWSLGWRMRSWRLNRQVFRSFWITERRIWRRNRAGGCSSMVVRKETFERAWGFDESMPAMQDWDLWLRLSRATRVRTLWGAYVLYNDHAGARISTNRSARIAGLARLLRKNADRWPRRVIAFHEARLAGEKFAAGQGTFTAIFHPMAPFASVFFAMRYLLSSIFHR